MNLRIVQLSVFTLLIHCNKSFSGYLVFGRGLVIVMGRPQIKLFYL